jgi:hypothetical protein
MVPMPKIPFNYYHIPSSYTRLKVFPANVFMRRGLVVVFSSTDKSTNTYSLSSDLAETHDERIRRFGPFPLS